MALKISEALLEDLRRHGEETYPHECCGVLAGKPGRDGVRTVLTVKRCNNADTNSPSNRYHIDPHDLIRIQAESRGAGSEIVGFYHSHPDHPARWSPTDLADAHWIDCSYLITSIERGKAVFTRSFLLLGPEEDKRFVEEDILVASHGGEGNQQEFDDAVDDAM